MSSPSSDPSSFDPRSETILNLDCRRIMRLCAKIEELALEDMENDTEEFLMNLRNVFLVLCCHLHTDLDYLEGVSCEGLPESYITAHQKVEEMYNQLRKRISMAHTTLVFEQKRDWFSQDPEEEPSPTVKEKMIYE